nr:MAG TPA: hypothetical protein [Caudoviricetes sp.]
MTLQSGGKALIIKTHRFKKSQNCALKNGLCFAAEHFKC